MIELIVKSIRVEKLQDFLCRTNYGSIYKVEHMKNIVTGIGMLLDEKNDLLSYDGKEVRLLYHYGFLDQKGYSVGALLWGIDCLLNDKEYPEMVCNFSRSPAYLMELVEKSKDAKKSIEEWLKNNGRNIE